MENKKEIINKKEFVKFYKAIQKDEIGFYSDMQTELEEHLRKAQELKVVFKLVLDGYIHTASRIEGRKRTLLNAIKLFGDVADEHKKEF